MSEIEMHQVHWFQEKPVTGTVRILPEEGGDRPVSGTVCVKELAQPGTGEHGITVTSELDAPYAAGSVILHSVGEVVAL